MGVEERGTCGDKAGPGVAAEEAATSGTDSDGVGVGCRVGDG